MHTVRREVDATYAHTLAVLAEAKRRAYGQGFFEGFCVGLAVVGLWWALTKI